MMLISEYICARLFPVDLDTCTCQFHSTGSGVSLLQEAWVTPGQELRRNDVSAFFQGRCKKGM